MAPSQVHLSSVVNNLRGDVSVGSQDVWMKGKGAFTGETSAEMLTDMGVTWSIVGHSERRGNGERYVFRASCFFVGRMYTIAYVRVAVFTRSV